MGEDDIATAYPEHLNPFQDAKKRSGLGNSFRNLKRVLRQSFRLKSREDKKTEARRGGLPARADQQGTETVALRRPAAVQRSNTLALPRSRFNDRVNHAKTLCPSSTDQLNASNPFDEEPDETDRNPFSEEEIASSSTLKKKYRRKKRAPLPPQLNRSEGDLLSVPDHHNSKWSLSSYETDISNYGSETDNELNEHDDVVPEDKEVSKDIQEMTAEIQKFCNNDIKEEDEGEGDSPPKDKTMLDGDAQSDSINNANLDVIIGDNADDNREPTTDNAVVGEGEEDSSELIGDEKRESVDKLQLEPIPDVEQINETISKHDLVAVDDKMNKADGDPAVLEAVSDDQNNNTDTVHFCESKSLYIAGSNDNLLDFNQRTSIYIAGSRDELNNNLSSADEIDESQPVPKVRKHKLTKGSLLGLPEDA